MSASAPLSFLESQTPHPCALLGGTRGYKEQESPRRELVVLEEMFVFLANWALEEASHWFLFDKQGINNILACPSPRVGTVPVLALLRDISGLNGTVAVPM